MTGAWQGAAGGLFGVLAGHWAVVGTSYLSPLSDLWFKGPHGPPFFQLQLGTAMFYAWLGLSLGRGKGRLRAAGGAFFAAFLIYLLPLAAATRLFAWGETGADEPTMAWFNLILTVHLAACTAAVWTAGALASPLKPMGKRAGLRAVAGAAVGYILGLTLRAVPALQPEMAPDVFPPLIAVLDGALSGACTGAALYWGKKTIWTKRTATDAATRVPDDSKV